VIVIGVERDLEQVGLRGGVASRELAAHARRVGIVQACRDVHGGVVERDAHVGPFGRGLALVRRGLVELCGGTGLRPDRLVELAVDVHRAASGGNACRVGQGRRAIVGVTHDAGIGGNGGGGWFRPGLLLLLGL